MAEEPVRDLFLLSLHQSGYSVFRFPRFFAQPQPPTDVESLRNILHRTGDYNTSFQALRIQLEISHVIPSEIVYISMGDVANNEVQETLTNFFRRHQDQFGGHNFAILDPRILNIQNKIQGLPRLDFSPRTKLLLRVMQQHVNSISEPLVETMAGITERTRTALRAAQEKKKIKEAGLGTSELRLNSYTRCIYRPEEDE
nr:hypothetical protein CFP56_55661 [Quercus suber]